MPPGIKVLHHSILFKNGTLGADSLVVSIDISIKANEIGTMRVVLSSNPGITKLDDCSVLIWFDNETPLNPGTFYIDSITQDEGQVIVDLLNFDFRTNPKGKYTYTNLSINQIVTLIAGNLNLTPFTSTNGTLIAGTTSDPATAVSISSDTSKIDVLFQIGEKYGYFHYVFNNTLYSIDFFRYWNETAPFILKSQTIDYQKNYNTIDTMKSVTGARFRLPSPGTYSIFDVDWVEYGEAVSLLDEGYNENGTAANSRIFGAVIEGTKNVKNFMCSREGSSAANYLPGRRINVDPILTGTDEPNVFVVRDVTHSYSERGWIMTLNLQRTDV